MHHSPWDGVRADGNRITDICPNLFGIIKISEMFLSCVADT